MDQEWAREPWKTAEGQFFIKGEDGWGSITDAQDWFIAKLEDSLDPGANAERIVACVNALAGLDPAGVKAAVDALQACRGVLAAATSVPGAADALAAADAALARVKPSR